MNLDHVLDPKAYFETMCKILIFTEQTLDNIFNFGGQNQCVILVAKCPYL